MAQQSRDISFIVRVCAHCNSGNPAYNTLQEYAAAKGMDNAVQKGYQCMGGCELGGRIDVEYSDGKVTMYAATPKRLPGKNYRKLPENLTDILSAAARNANK